MNSFTFAATEPSDGAAATQGSVGYLAIYAYGHPVGYSLSAYGQEGELLNWIQNPLSIGSSPDPLTITLTTLDRELLSLRNGVATRTAVRRWIKEL